MVEQQTPALPAPLFLPVPLPHMQPPGLLLWQVRVKLLWKVRTAPLLPLLEEPLGRGGDVERGELSEEWAVGRGG